MQGKKQWYQLLASVVLVMFLLPQVAWAEPYPGYEENKGLKYGFIGDIFIDGLRVQTREEKIYNYVFPGGKTMIPLEPYADFLGYTVDFNKTTGEVIVTDQGIKKWELKINSKEYYENGGKNPCRIQLCSMKKRVLLEERIFIFHWN